MPPSDTSEGGYTPGGDRTPNPHPEEPGGTAATKHPPAEPDDERGAETGESVDDSRQS